MLHPSQCLDRLKPRSGTYIRSELEPGAGVLLQ